MQYLDENRIRQVVREKISDERWKQSKLAEVLGCSTNLVSLMLNGKRNLNDAILSFAGYEKVVVYRKKESNAE